MKDEMEKKKPPVCLFLIVKKDQQSSVGEKMWK